MEKIKVNINDEVKLWNGEEETVSEFYLLLAVVNY